MAIQKLDDNTQAQGATGTSTTSGMPPADASNASLIAELGNAMDALQQGAPQSIEGGRFVGRNFYLSNGIPVELLLNLLKNNELQANSSFDMQMKTALSTGGFQEGEDGSFTLEGLSLAGLIAEAQQDAGLQEAIQSTLDGAKAMTGATVTMISGPILESYAGNTKAQSAKVDQANNAVKAAEKIDANATVASDMDLNELKAIPGMDSAIAKLKRGGVDFAAEDNHFGSVKSDGKDPSYKATDLDEGGYDPSVFKSAEEGNTDITVSQAIAAAGPKDRKAILAKMQKQADRAKDDLTAKNHEVQHKYNKAKLFFDGIAGISTGGFDIVKAGAMTQKAEEQADQTMIQDLNQGMKTVADRNQEQVTKTVQTRDQLLQQLEASIRSANRA